MKCRERRDEDNKIVTGTFKKMKEKKMQKKMGRGEMQDKKTNKFIIK